MKRKYKSIKTFIDRNNILTLTHGHLVTLDNPKYEIYIQETYFYGLFSRWIYRATTETDPKDFLDNIIESNY